MPEFLTLQEAAERLGVHYMTAYRYVRLGQLAARKERGTWRVAPSDLELFQQGDGSASSDVVSRKHVAWSQRFENRLLDGDASGAWKVIERALTAGTSPLGIYTEVVVPALDSIGSRWESGEIGVAEEHQASFLVTRLIGRLSPHFHRPGRRKGSVVVAGPPGERHFINLAMAADALRLGGYDPIEVGSDLPVDEFERTLRRHLPLKGVCLGVMSEETLEACRNMIFRARGVLPSEVPIVVGGRGIEGHDHALRMGADWAADLESVVEAIESGRRIVSAVSV